MEHIPKKPRLRVIEGGKKEERVYDKEESSLDSEIAMMSSDPLEDTFEFIEDDKDV